MESFKKDFAVEKVVDTIEDKAGEEDLKKKRVVSLKGEGVTATITGDPIELLLFKPGESIRLTVKNPQTSIADIQGSAPASVDVEEEGE